MSVCNYPRQTTPYIQSHAEKLSILCKAYSPYASTLSAIKAMLTDAPAGRENYIPQRSLLADAKIAGFKTFWISNQDDIYLSSLFASFADEAIFNNKRSGRSSFSKDEELLPYIADALADQAPKKLIIVHLIGSHPNYSARYPDTFALFPGKDPHIENQIAAELAEANAGLWVKQKRNEYDNSIAYQDWIFEQIFTMIQEDKTTWRGLIFLSDHGNEVGHSKDFAGHSPKTEAGYRVLIILWHSQLDLSKGINQENTFDAADLDHNVLHFMGLKRKTPLKPVLWTAENYRFSSPLFPYWENYKESKILKSGFAGQEKNLLPDPKNNE